MKPYYQHAGQKIYLGDCREVLPTLGPVDLVLTDPPYGITSNEWDTALDLRGFWDSAWGLTDTAVLCAGQPFTTDVISASRSEFCHEWIWIKDRGSNFANTVREPFKEHESVLVFSKGKWTYNAQLQKRSDLGRDRVKYPVASRTESSNYRQFECRGSVMRADQRLPSSHQKFNRDRGLHPTQKPLAMMNYFVRTYSNEGDTILDPFMGSGTTLRAAKDLGRECIGIEIEEKYCEIAARRLEQEVLAFAD